MDLNSGRRREAAEILRYKKAAAVGRLLLGEIDGPLEHLSIDDYIGKPRRSLLSERESARVFLRGEIAKFCRNNFEDIEPEDLVGLYEVLVQNRSQWFVPRIQFERDFGRFRGGVLRGAPLHSTIHISPWGLQTEYPEQDLMNDLGVSFNEAIAIEEVRLTPYRTTSWKRRKEAGTKAEIAELIRCRDTHQRHCVLSCFNLIEAYINGLAWDFAHTQDISSLSEDDRNVLTEEERPVNIIKKLVRTPVIIRKSVEANPLHQTRDPLKAFIGIVKPYRDAIVHASPFAAPERFGGYDKLSKLYGLSMKTVREAVDITASIIGALHGFIGGEESLPPWFLRREVDGKFLFGDKT